LTISNPCLKTVDSNASPWLNGLFFGYDDPVFLEELVKTYLMARIYACHGFPDNIQGNMLMFISVPS
jgi:hypothetical protein